MTSRWTYSFSQRKKRWPYWTFQHGNYCAWPYLFSKTKTWPFYCISFIWKKKNAYDVTTAKLVWWNNERLKRRPCWIVLVCKNMYMTSPCQRCVTYQPLGIQVYFNAKIIFCSSDQKKEALLISGKSNSIVFFCFLSSALQFIQIQFSNLIIRNFSLKMFTAP